MDDNSEKQNAEFGSSAFALDDEQAPNSRPKPKKQPTIEQIRIADFLQRLSGSVFTPKKNADYITLAIPEARVKNAVTVGRRKLTFIVTEMRETDVQDAARLNIIAKPMTKPLSKRLVLDDVTLEFVINPVSEEFLTRMLEDANLAARATITGDSKA